MAQKSSAQNVKYLFIFIALAATSLVVFEGLQAKQNLRSVRPPTISSTNLSLETISVGELGRENHNPGQLTLYDVADRESVYNTFHRSWKVAGNVNCTKVVDGDAEEVAKARTTMNVTARQGLTDEYYTNITDCKEFALSRGYIDHPLSTTERSFPLAFGIVVYKDVEQSERLLRLIYRPHNFYCFHVDSTTARQTRAAFEGLANCFPNVFVVEQPADVKWGTFTVLKAELLCMELLWKYRWKYYINLTGQELPLKTNLEIVEILKAMQGANVAFGMKTRTAMMAGRYSHAGLPPHGIVPIFGSVHVALNRDFVDFSLHDRKSKDFIKWLEKTGFSEELFFSSLNHNPQLGIPGSFLGEAEEYPKKPFFLRYKNWDPGAGVYHRKCFGKFQRRICVLGVGDLHKAVDDIGLFANKFELDFEYLGYDCLEKYIYERTWDEYVHDWPVDVTYYTLLDQVKYQVKKDSNWRPET